MKKFYAWHSKHREDINVASVLITLATLVYLTVFTVNWMLVTVLSFTGLKWLVWGVIGFAIGNTAYNIQTGQTRWNEDEEESEEEDNESRLL